jgi:hypothetical protein
VSRKPRFRRREPSVMNVAKAVARARVERQHYDFNVIEIGDCIYRAALLAAELQRYGYEARVAAGYHVMRVGPGEGDVVAHHPKAMMMPLSFTIIGPEGIVRSERDVGFIGHAWVRVGQFIIDDTTGDAGRKLAALDAFDGRSSSAEWAPDFLFSNVIGCKSYDRVVNGHVYGFHYDEVDDVTTHVMQTLASTMNVAA